MTKAVGLSVPPEWTLGRNAASDDLFLKHPIHEISRIWQRPVYILAHCGLNCSLLRLKDPDCDPNRHGSYYMFVRLR